MATFTRMLHDILDVDRPEDADSALIGLDSYPIFDESYRDTLNLNIIRHYWNREIGAETTSMFVHWVRSRMGLIMPAYNKLYESTLLDFDPFETVRLETHTEQEGSSTSSNEQDAVSQEESSSSNTSQSDTGSRTVNMEHPQTRLNNYEDYATASVDARSESTGISDATGTGSTTTTGQASASAHDEQEGTTVHTGFSGDRAALLQSFRDTIINVDVMIINDLGDLFMGIWDNNNSFTGEHLPYMSPWGIRW